MSYAPIVVFAFNRLIRLKATIESLRSNPEAKYSNLFIFVDGPRINNVRDTEKVNQVRLYVKTINGFNSVTHFFSDTNKGLANSIISGTSKIILQYGKIIVVEDDLYVSKSFLNYMNTLLQAYETDDRVMQISGYGPKFRVPNNYKLDFYLNKRAQSWTWATWKDRLETVDWDVNDYPELQNDKRKKRAFNRYGSDLFGMLNGYKEGRNNSWYIRFQYEMHKRGKYSICPVRSLVRNDGFGIEATNCNTYNRYKIDFHEDYQNNFEIPEKLEWSKIINKRAVKYWSIPYRIYGKLMTFLQ